MSSYLSLSRSELSKNLLGLRKKGYIKQSQGEKDHREMTTCLTTKGIVLLKDIDIGHNQLLNIAQEELPKKEQETFVILSNKIINVLHEERLANG
ncbi:MarR family winged helix-turn-helix transcriptional regulator [Oenococcus oeni]|uniref:MarR family winged helix-turn-helix transcriptional regulator n=1 Tax=Oenococcus oeni TaxID=1247 RepID=UPI001F2FAF40|nr:MarR family winged helix-turn-helix transcriptional regulator [Oenococcus oeni]